MFKLILFIGLMLVQACLSYAKEYKKDVSWDQLEGLDQDHEHLLVIWDQLIRDIPKNEILFFDKRDFKSKPSIVIDAVGVIIGVERRCVWIGPNLKAINLTTPRPESKTGEYVEKFFQLGKAKESERANPVSPGAYFPCFSPPVRPGTYLMIESLKDGVVEIKFEGKSYFANWEYAPGKKLGELLPSYASFKKKVFDTPEFKKYEKGVKECLASKVPENCIENFIYSIKLENMIKSRPTKKLPEDEKKEMVRTVRHCLEVEPTVYDYKTIIYYSNDYCDLVIEIDKNKRPLMWKFYNIGSP